MKKKLLVCLSAILVLAMALPVSAKSFSGTEQDESKAALTKIFRMSENIETPNVTFTFELEPISINKISSDGKNMPDVPNKTVSFSSVDTGESVDGVKVISKQSESLFDGVNWPHAGVYLYSVTEKASVTPDLGTGESIEYSKAKYNIEVYVANGENKLYVAAIGAEIVVTDGEYQEGESAKVDGTPGDPSIASTHSKITFTNTFTKTKGSGNPDDPNLVISKNVETKEGNGHDFANREKYFDFQIIVTKSGTNQSASQKYIAYVMNETDGVITSDKNYSGTILTNNPHGKYIEFTSDEQKTVKLKHGEWLSFVDLEVDASYTVTEIGTDNIAASCVQSVNSNKNYFNANSGQNLEVPRTYITIGDDRADFTNTFLPLTPVGITIDNLPYFIFLGLGLLTLILFVVFKKREKDEDETEASN